MGSLSAIVLNLFVQRARRRKRDRRRGRADDARPSGSRSSRSTRSPSDGVRRDVRPAVPGRAVDRPRSGRASARSTACTTCGTRSRARSSTRRRAPARADPRLPGHRGEGRARPGVARDQSSAGLDRLSPEEYERFDALNEAYRAKFGLPFLICVRENTKETILDDVRAPAGEHAAPGADGGARGDRQDRQPAAARPGGGTGSRPDAGAGSRGGARNGAGRVLAESEEGTRS